MEGLQAPKTPRFGDPVRALSRSVSPVSRNKRYSSNPDMGISSSSPSSSFRVVKTSPLCRRTSKSPYKPQRDNFDGGGGGVSSVRRNVSPMAKRADARRQISPFRNRVGEELSESEGEFVGSSTRHSRRLSSYNNLGVEEKEQRSSTQVLEWSKASERSNYSKNRSVSAPRPRIKEKGLQLKLGSVDERGRRSPSTLSISVMRNQKDLSPVKAPSASEVNEMVAKLKLESKGSGNDDATLESIESTFAGDIFFSREYTKLGLKKPNVPNKNGSTSNFDVVAERVTLVDQKNKVNTGFNPMLDVVSSSTLASQSNTISNSGGSRRITSRSSYDSSKSTESLRKFTANRQKKQNDMWFGCMRKGSCRTSKSPERKEFDEASFIQKAFVVENLRQFWADQHRPGSLNGFTCNKQQALLLKQMITHGNCPHVLFKGPSGSGKKALALALLREIYGDPAWNISHDLRSFHVQEKRPMRVIIPLTSSPHHIELNLKSEPKNAKYAVMALVKEMINNRAIAPEVSATSFTADYKVIVLHEADIIEENFQHLIKWIMDCHSDACKFIFCCEDDVDILDSIKSRFKVISVGSPVTHEIMEVLIQIARKENFDLPMSFAAKIATKSKQNLRKAIMALEACKAHNYPFADEQPIPLNWEEPVVELASEILANPSPQKLHIARMKFQKLLVDFVHPKLILQMLVEQFLKGVDLSLKRELYYWHAYYDKRLPVGTTAVLKLEEFLAKFMSIYRKSFRVEPLP
ncbi:hypothetical protein Syun_005083 [Stephania yunnanensis]|uniref:Replication factor C subunit 3 n=1 Tax=Stephania yunnanensis TaxID=152371 RepID=A0AAP0L4F6_9MAGN